MAVSPSNGSMDLDLINELFSEEGWSNSSHALQSPTSVFVSDFNSSCFSPFLNQQEDHKPNQLPLDEIRATCGVQSGELHASTSSSSSDANWLIQTTSPAVTVTERFIHVLRHIKESHRDWDVLIQIWVPVKRGDQQVLTTFGQPFMLDSPSERLMNYRTISTNFQFSAEENSNEALGLPGRVFVGKLPEWTPDVRLFSSYEFPRVFYAECYDVRGTIALPMFEQGSRSCLGVVEVAMTSENMNYSSNLEKISSALQVVNLRSCESSASPRLKVSDNSYQAALPEILTVLKAVCKKHKLPLAQTWNSCIQQGKRGSSRHTEENYKDCVSTVDAACIVNEPSMRGFHEACSEHHLLRGQGLVGQAFTTNQPCFSPDITTFSKIQYPLSHHARMFHLRAAVAIRLRSISNGLLVDFVLELFLPADECLGTEEEQKLMLDALFVTLQQTCRSLRVLTTQELEEEEEEEEEEEANQLSGLITPSGFLQETSGCEGSHEQQSHGNAAVPLEACEAAVHEGAPSWKTIVDAQQIDQESSMPPSLLSLTTDQMDLAEVDLPVGVGDTHCLLEFRDRGGLNEDTSEHPGSFPDEPSSAASKETAKRRTKAEKSISLQDLRRHFAGNLKDAAKSLGVCPTTLKRKCRQHGISRWPSRKIQKVGHSLKKLQVVIDTVHQGTTDVAFQLSSIYENFTKASWSVENSPGGAAGANLVSAEEGRQQQQQQQQVHPEPEPEPEPEPSSSVHHHHQEQEEELFSRQASAAVNSVSSSSCSQSPTISSPSSSSGRTQNKTYNEQLAIKQQPNKEENQTAGMRKRELSKLIKLQHPLEKERLRNLMSRSQSEHHHHHHHDSFPGSLLPSPLQKETDDHHSNILLLRVKATYGQEKVRFKLQPTWSFKDLKQEVAKRFSIVNLSSINLKYMDDDSEWVLLTCDADLQECIDVCKSSSDHTMRISIRSTTVPHAGTAVP